MATQKMRRKTKVLTWADEKSLRGKREIQEKRRKARRQKEARKDE